jgi:hypothetical protein
VSGPAGGFLARWSRRKTRSAREEATQRVPPVPPAQDEARAAASIEQGAGLPVQAQAADASGPKAALPTLDDVERLTAQSDFSRFAAPDVDAGVRNAAMRKLFADPHFNVMDGLDTYIDDYGKPDPIPESMLRRMASAAALGLFDDQKAAEPAADNRPAHEDPAVQLQPDDAAGRPGPGEEPGPGCADDPQHPVPPRST